MLSSICSEGTKTRSASDTLRSVEVTEHRLKSDSGVRRTLLDVNLGNTVTSHMTGPIISTLQPQLPHL
jgi:hypothetical protein